MGVRRVVTGHSTEGKAIVASDEVVEPIRLALLPGFEFVRLWGADTAPQFPGDGSMPAHHAYFPRSVASGSGCSPCRRQPM